MCFIDIIVHFHYVYSMFEVAFCQLCIEQMCVCSVTLDLQLPCFLLLYFPILLADRLGICEQIA